MLRQRQEPLIDAASFGLSAMPGSDILTHLPGRRFDFTISYRRNGEVGVLSLRGNYWSQIATISNRQLELSTRGFLVKASGHARQK